MANPEALMQPENTTSKQVQFLNAFANIANKAMNEYHNNIHKKIVRDVKIPNQTKEELE